MKTYKASFQDKNGKELYSICLVTETFEEAYEIADTIMCNSPDDSIQIVVNEVKL